jgi:hypothetical protein
MHVTRHVVLLILLGLYLVSGFESPFEDTRILNFVLLNLGRRHVTGDTFVA